MTVTISETNVAVNIKEAAEVVDQMSSPPGTLFSTIAPQLADCDALRKQRLVDVIARDTSIRTTEICKSQFKHFIVTPSENLPTVGKTIIVIDAFHKIGDERMRAESLSILTQRASELPDGLRILVTSRFEFDIQRALGSALQMPGDAAVGYVLMGNIPKHLTSRDIGIYVQDQLRYDSFNSDEQTSCGDVFSMDTHGLSLYK